MCWLDKIAIEQFRKMRDNFSINTFIETGTFRGINALFESYNFKEVLTCDISDYYLQIAREKLKNRNNVTIIQEDSAVFLHTFMNNYKKNKRDDIVFIYLDAHFYDARLPQNKKWVVINELKALKNFDKCIICIHDFYCDGLNGLCYGGEKLDLSLVLKDIVNINPNFNMYTNTLDFCDIYNVENIRQVKEVTIDKEMIETLEHVNSCDRLKYRGILYCVPFPLDLRKYKLVELKS